MRIGLSILACAAMLLEGACVPYLSNYASDSYDPPRDLARNTSPDSPVLVLPVWWKKEDERRYVRSPFVAKAGAVASGKAVPSARLGIGGIDVLGKVDGFDNSVEADRQGIDLVLVVTPEGNVFLYRTSGGAARGVLTRELRDALRQELDHDYPIRSLLRVRTESGDRLISGYPQLELDASASERRQAKRFLAKVAER